MVMRGIGGGGGKLIIAGLNSWGKIFFLKKEEIEKWGIGGVGGGGSSYNCRVKYVCKYIFPEK